MCTLVYVHTETSYEFATYMYKLRAYNQNLICIDTNESEFLFVRKIYR